MALNDSVAAMTAAVNDAANEMRTLAQTIQDTGDVQAASDQINALASNLEQAVTDAQAQSAPPSTGGTEPPPAP